MACLDPAKPWAQPEATKSPSVPADHSSNGSPLPLGLLPVQHTCFAFGQPIAGVTACQWHAFISVPIILIAPSSHAGAGGMRKAVASSRGYLGTLQPVEPAKATQKHRRVKSLEGSTQLASVGCCPWLTGPQPSFPLQMPPAAWL